MTTLHVHWRLACLYRSAILSMLRDFKQGVMICTLSRATSGNGQRTHSRPPSLADYPFVFRAHSLPDYYSRIFSL